MAALNLADAFCRHAMERVVYLALCDAHQRPFQWVAVDLREADRVLFPVWVGPPMVACWIAFCDVMTEPLWYQEISPVEPVRMVDVRLYPPGVLLA